MANVRRFLSSGLTRLGLIPYSELDISNSVATGDIVDGAITVGKLSDGSVWTVKLADLAVTTAKMADNAVTNAKLATDSVTVTKVASDSITNAKMADASVSTAELVDLSVTTAKHADTSVTAAKLASNAVTDAKVDPAAAIAVSKLAAGTNGYVLTVGGGITQWSSIGSIPPTDATARFAGEITWHAGDTLPGGWLNADGSAVSRATYANLFTAIGVLHGAGDGSTTFNLPNLQNKVARGRGTANVGATGGSDTVTLVTNNLPSHTHDATGLSTANESAHTHGIGSYVAANAGTHGHTGATGTVGGHEHATTVLPIPLFNRGPTYGSSTGRGIYAASPDELVYTFTASGVTTSTAGSHNHAIVNDGDHTHTLSGTSAAGSAHSHSIAGTIGNTGSGTAADVKPAHVILRPLIKT